MGARKALQQGYATCTAVVGRRLCGKEGVILNGLSAAILTDRDLASSIHEHASIIPSLASARASVLAAASIVFEYLTRRVMRGREGGGKKGGGEGRKTTEGSGKGYGPA